MALNKLFSEILKGATKAVPKTNRIVEQGVADFIARSQAEGRTKLLNEIFEKGVKGVDKEDLARLFAETPETEKLFRGDTFGGIPLRSWRRLKSRLRAGTASVRCSAGRD